jgi:transaldolase
MRIAFIRVTVTNKASRRPYRDLITSGKLAQLIHDDVTGLTSNPAIFEKAITAAITTTTFLTGEKAFNATLERSVAACALGQHVDEESEIPRCALPGGLVAIR